MRIHLETRKARKAGAPRVASETPELDGGCRAKAGGRGVSDVGGGDRRA